MPLGKQFINNINNFCAARSAFAALGGASFSSERSPSVSEGGWSEDVKNREGVASGGATQFFA